MPSPTTEESSTTTAVARSKRSFRRVWIIAASIIIAIPMLYGVIFSIYWPFTKQDVINALQERSLRPVTIGQFHTTYFPPGCVAEQVAFLHIKNKNRPPLITIGRLAVSTTYPMLLTFQHRLAVVRVENLHVTVPAQEPAGDPSPVMPLTAAGNAKGSMPINNLYADGALLDFYRKSTPKPLRITVNKLNLHHINANSALTYEVQLYNSEPPGIIESEGSFGPWNPKNPGGVPVHGSFGYNDANLFFFKEISGTLFAGGKFDGNLARINVAGAAQVPSFTLTGSSHKRPLAVTYQVGVNAINGDLDLTKLSADFDQTDLLVAGSVSGVKGHPGKNLSLDMSSRHARIENLMGLFISGNQPPMTGDVVFRLHVEVPANSDSFLRAMTANGGFGIVSGKFADKQTEQGLTKLSEGTKAGKSAQTENPQTLLSDLKGNITIAGGLTHLSRVEFQIPEAHAWLDGTYSLLDYQTEIHGVLITKGNISVTQTGLKSVLLKTLTPFFKHKNHAEIVPFKIAGPYGRANISLDLDRKRDQNK